MSQIDRLNDLIEFFATLNDQIKIGWQLERDTFVITIMMMIIIIVN